MRKYIDEKERWSEERSMCSFLASRFQILLHLIMSAYLSDCFGQRTFNKIWLSWHLVLLQLRVMLAGESTTVIVWCIILWWCCVSSLLFFCVANVVAINVTCVVGLYPFIGLILLNQFNKTEKIHIKIHRKIHID